MRLKHTGGIAMAATLRVRAYLLVLVLLLTTISVACAADQTITLRLGAKTGLALEGPFETVLMAIRISLMLIRSVSAGSL